MVYRNYSLPLQYVHFVSHMCWVLCSIQDANKMKTCLWNHMVQTTKGYAKLSQLCFLFWFFAYGLGNKTQTQHTYLLKFFLMHLVRMTYLYIQYSHLIFSRTISVFVLHSSGKCLNAAAIIIMTSKLAFTVYCFLWSKCEGWIAGTHNLQKFKHKEIIICLC